MRIRTILRLAAISLPVVMGGCADTSLDTVGGDERWVLGDLAAEPHERGKRHFADGLFGLAIGDFQKALARDPESVVALNGLAAAYDRLGRFDQSERYYLRALNLKPDSVQSLNNLGYSYLMQRRYDLAMTYLRDARALEPADTLIARNLEKAEAATELAGGEFMAAPVQSGRSERLARSAPGAKTHEAAPAADAPHATKAATSAVASDAERAGAVHIVALGARSNPWIERTAPVVQSLITQARPEIDLAVRDWGVKAALANYRPRSALEASADRGSPWDVMGRPAAPEALEPAPREASAVPEALEPAPRDPLRASLAEFFPTAAGGTSDRPVVEGRQVALARTDEIAIVERPPMKLVTLLEAVLEPASPVDAASPVNDSTSPMNLVPRELLEAGDGRPETLGPIDLLPVDFAMNFTVDPSVNIDLPMDESPAGPASGDETPLVEVSNGTGRLSMALRMGEFLRNKGFPIPRLTNAEHFGFQETTIYYRDGWLDQARRITAALPAETLLEAAPDQAVDIRIRLGGDLLNFDRELFYAERKPSSAPTG